jgi:hypothetical protein
VNAVSSCDSGVIVAVSDIRANSTHAIVQRSHRANLVLSILFSKFDITSQVKSSSNLTTDGSGASVMQRKNVVLKNKRVRIPLEQAEVGRRTGRSCFDACREFLWILYVSV